MENGTSPDLLTMQSVLRTRKLTAEDRENLILYWRAGMSQRALALKFGVTEPTISYHIRRFSGAGAGQTTVGLRKFDVEATRAALRTALAVTVVAGKAVDEVAKQIRALVTQTEYAEQSATRILGAGRDFYDASKVVTWTVADERELDRLLGQMHRDYDEDTLNMSVGEYPEPLAELFDRIDTLQQRRMATMREEE